MTVPPADDDRRVAKKHYIDLLWYYEDLERIEYNLANPLPPATDWESNKQKRERNRRTSTTEERNDTINKINEKTMKFLENDALNLKDIPVLVTLAGSVNKTLLKWVLPSVTHLLIDEAAMALESTALIPITNCPQLQKLVLIGDENQLTAPIKSERILKEIRSGDSKAGLSLFERLVQERLDSDIQLDEQRRMHSSLSWYPKLFYPYSKNNVMGEKFLFRPEKVKDTDQLIKDCLDDLTDVAIIPGFPWVKFKSTEENRDSDCFRLAFIDTDNASSDINGGNFIERTPGDSNSKTNDDEAVLCSEILENILDSASDHSLKSQDVGVITGYQEMVKALKETVSAKKLPDHKKIDISTVDGFQGGEKKLIILSMVRTESLGFLKDRNRMLVMLTRAKCGMIIVGSRRTMLKSSQYKDYWTPLVRRLENKDAVFKVEEYREWSKWYKKSNRENSTDSDRVKSKLNQKDPSNWRIALKDSEDDYDVIFGGRKKSKVGDFTTPDFATSVSDSQEFKSKTDLSSLHIFPVTPEEISSSENCRTFEEAKSRHKEITSGLNSINEMPSGRDASATSVLGHRGANYKVAKYSCATGDISGRSSRVFLTFKGHEILEDVVDASKECQSWMKRKRGGQNIQGEK